jgi:hypothetical protein
MTWTKHGYGALGALELSCIILSFIVIFIGFISIMSNIKICTVIFIILSFLCSLFVLAVSIFCFIATKTRYWKDYLGCTADYKGFLSVWNSVDTYLQLVDSYLCSEDCPCKFNTEMINLYTSNTSTSPYFNMWYIDRNSFYRKNINYCIPSGNPKEKSSKNEKKELYKKLKEIYVLRNAYFGHTFRVDWFHKYYKHIERHFKCTGFCGVSYFNNYTNTNQKIVKYLFSDMTKEIPEHFGCIGAIMDWLRKTLIAFAIVCLFLFLCLIILFIIGLMILCNDSDETNELISNSENSQEEPQEKKINEETKKDNDSKQGSVITNLENMSFEPTNDQKKEKDIKFNPSIVNQ